MVVKSESIVFVKSWESLKKCGNQSFSCPLFWIPGSAQSTFGASKTRFPFQKEMDSLIRNSKKDFIQLESITKETNTSEDWSSIIEVCERADESESVAREVAALLVKRLEHRNVNVGGFENGSKFMDARCSSSL